MSDNIAQRHRQIFQRRRLLLIIAAYLAIHLQNSAYQLMSQASGSRGSQRKHRGEASRRPKTGRIDAELEVDPDSAPTSSAKKDKALWTREEIRALVEYLHSKRSTSDGGFKSSVWNGAVEHLQEMFPKVIPPKKSTQLRNKWNSGDYSVRSHISA